MSKQKPHARNLDHEEMKRLYAEGMTCKEIAAKFGCSLDTAHRIIKPGRHNSKAITRAQINDMLVYRDLGLSNQQIAIEMGLSYQSVVRYLGPQPAGNRSEYGSIVAHATGETYVNAAKAEAQKEETKTMNAMQQTIERAKSSTLILESIITSYKGHSCSYKYSDTSKQIRITAPNGDNLTIMKEDFLYFANEVFELAMKLA